MSNTFRTGCMCISFLLGARHAHAQQTRVPAPQRTAAPAALAAGAVAEQDTEPTAPSNLTAAGGGNTEIFLTWDASTESGGAIARYGIERCPGSGEDCTPFTQIDTSPTNTFSDKDLTYNTTYTYRVFATDAKGKDSDPSKPFSITTGTSKFTCWVIPTRAHCMDFGPPAGVDRHTKIYSNINGFYQTTGSFSFFNQIKSIYNGASGSATVSADLATLNFSDGLQLTVASNVQAGSSGAASVSSATIPTLSANGAGQATQNILFGGTFVVSQLYPLLAVGASRWGSPGGVGVIVDLILKEGADVQNFKSGTNISVTSPPFHGSAQMEGYLQYNSINLAPSSQHFAGSLFFGGAYGYNYMSRAYARDYGFGSQFQNGVGQVSFGILINGVAKIIVSRAFGPSQTYFDSATMTNATPRPTTVNNFRSWSFGVAYQSPSPTK